MSGFKPIPDSALRLTGFGEMMGNKLWRSPCERGEALFQRQCDGSVEASAALAKQSAVSRITNECMLEQVSCVVPFPTSEDQLRRTKVVKGSRQLVPTEACHQGQQLVGDLPAYHGPGLRHR